MTDKLLVSGAGGQVGRAVCKLAERHGFEAVGLTSANLDITDADAVARAADAHAPAAVVNAAAYTAVDKAETDESRAHAVNADGPANLARAFAGLPILHYSTDYVFGGDAQVPYKEQDATNPQGAYGRTKLAGEAPVLSEGGTVMRTGWVYDERGPNFLRTMLRVGRERGALSVVDDQHGTPTHAADIAEASLRMLRRQVDDAAAPRGLYHYTASGQTTWAGFAEAIFDALADQTGERVALTRITTADYPTPAARPAYSVLDGAKVERDHGVARPDWRAPVAGTVEAALATGG